MRGNIIIKADELATKELYVAMTRAKSLMVFSSNPVIQKDAPADLYPPRQIQD
jgi:ATP-dependent exoDNAse (exonuclease V) beta subunit